MNEIEKLYENAGIKDKCGYICSAKGIGCNECPNKNRKFTAEKQLELIKWMIKTNHRYFIQDVFECEFEESLAKVLNLYWQDLTEQERTEIKRILE